MLAAQELAAGTHSVTLATPLVRLAGGAASELIEELDRSLQQLQHACHGEPGPDGEWGAVATAPKHTCTAQNMCILMYSRHAAVK